MRHLKQYLASFSAAFGALCLGASIGWSGPMESPIVTGDAYDFSPTHDEWGWISAMLTLGAACMCIPVGILIERCGRKATMLGLVPPYALGWVAIIYPPHKVLLFIGRFLVGACGGSFCVTAPMYITEIAHVEIRGALGCFFQLLIVHGILYGFVVCAYMKPLLANILCGILPVIFFLHFMWMPESPVYLVQKGKPEKAEKSLKWLRGKDADVSGELNSMAIEAKKEKAPIKEAFARRETIRGLIISIILMMLQQFTGVNAILFYATGIFEAAHTGINPKECTIIIGGIQVVATVVAILSIEKIGRRYLLLISAAAMCLSTFLMGFYFYYLMNKDVGWLPLMLVAIFIIGFSLGFGPVPWLIMAELFAEDVKPVCGAIAGTTNWLFAFCVTKLFPVFLDNFGSAATFWVFAVVAALAIIFVFFLVPETKGKTLNEIQAELGG